MAGYLGTLFMANVGMRLLLPPQSEYTKAATGFGRMVSNIQQRQKGYFSAASKTNVESLRQTLSKSSSLAIQYGAKQGKVTLKNLTQNLSKIKSLTDTNLKSIGSNAPGIASSYKNIQRIQSNMPTGPRKGQSRESFAARYGRDLAQIEVHLKRIAITQTAATRSFTKGADEIGRFGGVLVGAFRGAVTTSITMLTTLGYTIKGLSQDFAVFERELINANSIWQETSETLFEISDRVIRFGEEYGVAYDNASRVLYQFASAGLEAAEAQAVLNDVLLLSMAVQGDANTIGKLTVQTIKGFGLEMADAGEVTDKFAHSINASLIEYQDLASAIKFALPFYAATNQDLNQLLGSIQILTDRALEAGIAGRGLRQALAEFAEGAEDATRKFAKMGVEVVNQEGEFLQMTEIARNFANVIGGTVANDTELLTSLIEDLNIRGATAFIHLVQNVDEFEEAVAELSNSQGASKKMADMQQTSLAMLTQKMRNAMKEVFFLSEAQFVANGHMNEFDMRLKGLVTDFTELFLETMPDGTKRLTEFSFNIRELVMTTLEGFSKLMETLVTQLIDMTQQGFSLADMARTLFMPLNALGKILEMTGNILGTGVSGNGLIFKYYMLSMVFGQIGAGALMASDAVGNLLGRMSQLGDIMGPVIALAGVLSMVSGLGLVAGGARAGGAAGVRSGYSLSKMTSFRTASAANTRRIAPGYTGRNKAGDYYKQTIPDNYQSLSKIREGKINAYGGYNKATGEILYKEGSATKMYNAQEMPSWAPTVKGWAAEQGILDFENDYIRQIGMSRIKAGLLGAYTGYQSYAYDPMMAQMSTSSNMTSTGQDLYIANANIGSTNLQDLFYNSDQLGN